MTQGYLARSRVLYNQHLDQRLLLGSGQKGPRKAKIKGILL